MSQKNLCPIDNWGARWLSHPISRLVGYTPNWGKNEIYSIWWVHGMQRNIIFGCAWKLWTRTMFSRLGKWWWTIVFLDLKLFGTRPHDSRSIFSWDAETHTTHVLLQTWRRFSVRWIRFLSWTRLAHQATKPLWFWHFYSCSPWTVVTGPEPHLSDMSIWWAKKRIRWYSLVKIISRVVRLKWTDQIVADPPKTVQNPARDNYPSLTVQPHLMNPIISLPISTAFQRAEAECLIKSAMRNKQYKPRGVPKSVLPFSLPLLNPKANIHDAGGPHKKETRNISHEFFLLCQNFSQTIMWVTHTHTYTPVFDGVHGVVAVFSGTFHAEEWNKQTRTMI